MNVVLWVLLSYAIGMTLLYARKTYHKERSVGLREALKDCNTEKVSATDRAEIISKIAEAEHSFSPWYEKSLSTAGVIAFFAMLVAASVQTVMVTRESFKLDQLQVQIDSLAEGKKYADSVIKDAVQTIVDKHQLGGRLYREEKLLLEHRLRQLEKINSLSKAEFAELYRLQLLLGRFFAATDLLEEHKALLDMTAPADIISLAEYYYLEGAGEVARKLLDSLNVKLPQLSAPWQIRYMVLRTVFEPEGKDDYILRLSSLLKVSTAEARTQLNYQVIRWKSAALMVSDRDD